MFCVRSAQVSLTSLSLAHDDMITQEGIETLVGLRALVSLDVTGCKVKEKTFFSLSSSSSRFHNFVADLETLRSDAVWFHVFLWSDRHEVIILPWYIVLSSSCCTSGAESPSQRRCCRVQGEGGSAAFDTSSWRMVLYTWQYMQ